MLTVLAALQTLLGVGVVQVVGHTDNNELDFRIVNDIVEGLDDLDRLAPFVLSNGFSHISIPIDLSRSLHHRVKVEEIGVRDDERGMKHVQAHSYGTWRSDMGMVSLRRF